LQQLLARAAAQREQLAVGSMDSKPQLKLAVLTCMDTRIDPLPLLGLERGQAHVIRNAGGLASDDAIRSLAASQRLLGTEEVVVIMHEHCGLCGASEDSFAAELAADGALPPWRLGAFEKLEGALAASLARLRSAPELPHRDRVFGMVFNPVDGALRLIDG